MILSIYYLLIIFTVCPSGYKAENNTCVRCPFGYSGFNCDDSSLLALVVVACVLGGILLIVILAVLIYICVTRCNKKSSSNFSTARTLLRSSRPRGPLRASPVFHVSI
ncbi:mucin-13-like [Carassius auratus]|uniref:Mucin-13-like n=1 Tax=Carassius auratus TaxID=7957 RepID=A0A6P6N319_CARAU|nr:mucin-13-like [Carassius auratus]